MAGREPEAAGCDVMRQTKNCQGKYAGKIDGFGAPYLKQIRLPPDKQQQAVETVMKQVEILADKWAVRN